MERSNDEARRREQRRRPRRQSTQQGTQDLSRDARRTQGARRASRAAAYTEDARGTQGQRVARPQHRSRPNGSTQQRRTQGRPQRSGVRQQQRTIGHTGRVSRRTASQDAVRRGGHQANRRQRTFSPLIIASGVAGVVLVGLLGWFLFGILTRFDVTVNGDKVTLDRGSTVQTLLDKGYVSPKPGNLLAVDGSLLEKGQGAVCTAKVDGKKAKVDTPLAANNEVTITDGGDLTEKATVVEETIPFEKKEGDRSFEAYWYGSIHLLSDGVDGVRTVTTGKKSGKTVTEVTKAAINAGYRIYTAKPEEKVIALTFDDGPWPKTTDQILDILDEYGAKATFFTIGEQISQTEDALVRAYEAGHQICTHTWDHAAGSGGGVSIAVMSASEQVEEIEKGYAAIEEATGKEPSHVIRAPGGNFYGDVIDNVWDIVDAEIGWDVDTEDWSRPGADYITEMILSAKSGQVVLMHDGGGDRTQTVEALRAAMPTLVEEGYKFVTIDELIDYGMPTTTNSIPTTTDDEDDSSSDADDSEDASEESSDDIYFT